MSEVEPTTGLNFGGNYGSSAKTADPIVKKTTVLLPDNAVRTTIRGTEIGILEQDRGVRVIVADTDPVVQSRILGLLQLALTDANKAYVVKQETDGLTFSASSENATIKKPLETADVQAAVNKLTTESYVKSLVAGMKPSGGVTRGF